MTSEHIDQTLAQAQQKLSEQEAAVANTKRFINTLLEFAGRPKAYEDVQATGMSLTLRGDEFFGQKQSTACRLVLERRKATSLGPATVDEIFETLKLGGYQHEARDDEMARKSLYNMLTQNSGIFQRLPSGKFGLATWYPNAPKKRRAKDASELSADDASDDSTEPSAGDIAVPADDGGAA